VFSCAAHHWSDNGKFWGKWKRVCSEHPGGPEESIYDLLWWWSVLPVLGPVQWLITCSIETLPQQL
jgi:hypothetical protein